MNLNLNMRQLKIEYRTTASIKPDVGNARTHSNVQIEQIKTSIQAFGFTNPILINSESVIIAGHGRLRAAKDCQMDKVPTIMLDGLTDAQVRCLRLADNKIALNAGWDLDILKGELADLSSVNLDLDLSLTGFSIGEIDLVLGEDPDPEDEVIPAVPTEPKVRTGDIWELGDHRIGCGDGRDIDFLNKVIGDDKQVDVAFLDPPYNVQISGHANAKGRHREFAMASGEMSSSEFVTFLKETLAACIAVSRNGAVHFVCMDWRHIDELSQAGTDIYDERLNICVWNKSNAGMGSLYRSKHELIFVYRAGSEQHLNNVELGKHGRNRTNIWDYASVNSLAGSRKEDLALHPTVKPTAMVADAIKDVSRRGDLVLDIFLGSGTTLIAAERSGRLFRGVEIDPSYVEVAIQRWQTITNQEPKLIERVEK